MLAERVTIETDAEGNLAGMPKLPPNSKFEVIFLFLDQPQNNHMQQPVGLNSDAHPQFRKISKKIAGKGKILGDIISPIVPESDWEAMR